MKLSLKLYCPGYGGPHIAPNAGRPVLVCSRCRWSPSYSDPPEQKARVLAAMKGKK